MLCCFSCLKIWIVRAMIFSDIDVVFLFCKIYDQIKNDGFGVGNQALLLRLILLFFSKVLPWFEAPKSVVRAFWAC